MLGFAQRDLDLQLFFASNYFQCDLIPRLIFEHCMDVRMSFIDRLEADPNVGPCEISLDYSVTCQSTSQSRASSNDYNQ
jgi:hypothetical protein